MDRPVTATNDLHELKTIHRRLFQDVYDWAGPIRIIDVRKDVPGAEFFMPWVYILDLQPLIEMFEKVVAEPTGLDSSDWRRREIERLSIGDAGRSPSVE